MTDSYTCRVRNKAYHDAIKRGFSENEAQRAANVAFLTTRF